MVQDFRPINDVTIPDVKPVPDPYLALQNISPTQDWFSVTDLANAFFCIPLHADSQPLFHSLFHLPKSVSYLLQTATEVQGLARNLLLDPEGTPGRAHFTRWGNSSPIR